MAWGTEQNDGTARTGVAGTESNGGTISLNAGETASGYVSVDKDNGAGAPVDPVRIRVYVSTDGGTTWSDQAIIDYEFLPSDAAARRSPLSVTGWPTFRVTLVRASGTTDTYTWQYLYKLDGVSL